MARTWLEDEGQMRVSCGEGLAKEQAGKKFAYVMVTRMSLCRALKNFKNAIPSIPTRSLLHRLIVSLFVLQNIQHVHGTDLHHD